MNRIVAVVGMCGSGKSVVTEVFRGRGWDTVYFGGVTMKILAEEGFEKTPENEKTVRERLRSEYGMAAYAVTLESEIREKAEKGPVVLDGLYSWSEYKYLYDRLDGNLTLLAVIANKADRYSRLTGREVRPLTPDQARSRDIAEIENLEKGGPIAFADEYIVNFGSLGALKEQTERFIASLK